MPIAFSTRSISLLDIADERARQQRRGVEVRDLIDAARGYEDTLAHLALSGASMTGRPTNDSFADAALRQLVRRPVRLTADMRYVLLGAPTLAGGTRCRSLTSIHLLEVAIAVAPEVVDRGLVRLRTELAQLRHMDELPVTEAGRWWIAE